MEWLFGKKMTPDEMLRKVKVVKVSVLMFFYIINCYSNVFVVLNCGTESASSEQSNERS